MKRMSVTPKKSNTVYIEKRCINWLLFISIITIVMAIIIEICNNDNKFLCFFINILLGISASSAISFISIYIPFMLKRKNEVESYVSSAIEIYNEYSKLITQLTITYDNLLDINNKKDYTDLRNQYQFIKEGISENSKAIKRKIEEFKDISQKLQFTSKKINNIDTIIISRMNKAINIVLRYYEALNDKLDMLKEYLQDEYISFISEFALEVNKCINSKCPEICNQLYELLNINDYTKDRLFFNDFRILNESLLNELKEYQEKKENATIALSASTFITQKMNESLKNH